jgi:hypothetical protein
VASLRPVRQFFDKLNFWCCLKDWYWNPEWDRHPVSPVYTHTVVAVVSVSSARISWALWTSANWRNTTTIRISSIIDLQFALADYICCRSAVVFQICRLWTGFLYGRYGGTMCALRILWWNQRLSRFVRKFCAVEKAVVLLLTFADDCERFDNFSFVCVLEYPTFASLFK